jgi:hypothetical protein
MNLLEQIFSQHLIKLIPDIHQAVTTDLIQNKSRIIHEAPSLSCWLECYRCSKSIFNFSILSMLENTDNASIFQEQFAISLLPENNKKQLVENTINEIRAYSDEEKVKFNSELSDYIAQFKDESDLLFSGKKRKGVRSAFNDSRLFSANFHYPYQLQEKLHQQQVLILSYVFVCTANVRCVAATRANHLDS